MPFWIDIKYAARLLHKKPAFTAVAVFIVAIGLGLTLYTYSLLSSLVFKPLTMNGDNPIVIVEAEYDHSHLRRRGADPFDLQRLHSENDLFSDLGIYTEGTTFVGSLINNALTLSGNKKVNATYTSWNVFEISGVQPMLGRGFSPEDHIEGAPPVVVLGHQIWLNSFSGDKDVIGKMVELDAEPVRIIGVMPAGFSFPEVAEIWQPLTQNYTNPTDRTFYGYHGFARLLDNVELHQVNSVLKGMNKEIIPALPENMSWRESANGGYLAAVHFKKANITQYYSIFIALFIVVFLILLLACINVGNLLLSRVNERFKEIAIRVALGIPRKRLVMQMLWESIFICLVGGFLAILIAAWGLEVTNAVFDQTFSVDNLKPFWWHVALDSDAVIMLVISVLMMILITGCIPAWRALSGDFNAVLRDGTRGALGKQAAKMSKLLVISEILLSCVVLVMAIILLTTSYAAGNADYGVETQSRLTARLQLPPVGYPVRRDTEHEEADLLKRSAFYYDLKAEMEAMPNIEAVSFMSQLPGTGEGTSHFEIEGRGAQVHTENPYSNNELASSDAWRAIGMKVLAGRSFDHRDIGSDVRSIIVNESIVRDFFPDGNAVGQRVRRANRNSFGEWNTIIGVVSDTFHGTTMRSSSTSYNSYHLMDSRGMGRATIAIHFTGNQALAQKSLMQAIELVDVNVGAYHIQSYDNLIKQPMLLVSALSKIFIICGAIAVFLAASGIYALSANSITQRTQEIGVRRALGASDGNIMQLFIKQASAQLLIGLSIGIILSLWLVNNITDTMVINSNSYIISLIGVPALIIVMVIFATYIPTRKVIKLEPGDALHHD